MTDHRYFLVGGRFLCVILKNMKLKVIIEPGEDRGFVARVPALQGCWSQGDTRQEVLINVREAVEAWLEAEQDKAEISNTNRDVELISV